MKIQSRIWLSIAASLAVSGVLAFFVFSSFREIGDDLVRGRIYSAIIQKAFALDVLVATFGQESSQRHIQQFGEVRASLTKLLYGLTSSDTREESLIRQIQRNNQELGSLLDQFLARRKERDGLQAELKKMLATQLWTKVRFIIDDTSRLMQISESRIVSSYTRAGVMVLFLLIALMAGNVIISLISGRSIVRMQESLQKQREWLQVTLTSIGDAVMATDAVSRITFLNPVASALIGWPVQEALGRPLQDLFRVINEKTREPAGDIVSRTLREGANVDLGNHSVLVDRDGREIPIEDSAAPIRDDTGKVAGVVLVFHDVTEKRRAREALREAHERALWLARFPDENPNPVVRVSANGTVLYCNPSAVKMPGWTCVVGQPLGDRLLPLVSRAMAGGKEAQQDVEIGGRFYSAWVAPFPGEGYANVYGRDITERKRMEEDLKERTLELQQLTETLEHRVKERTAELADLSSRLVSAQENERKRVSYDLHDNVWQTLLAIRFGLEHLFSSQDKADWAGLYKKSKEVMADIMGAVGKIRSMQGDLWPYVLDDIGLLATIDWYCREFQKTYSGPTIERRVDLREDEVPSSAKIVIYRVMQEAMSNVVKHSQAKHVYLSLISRDQTVEFTVADNGIGFDPEETLVKRTPWGGLGLLSIKARTELAGGIFGLESAKGKGTTVRASWPR